MPQSAAREAGQAADLALIERMRAGDGRAAEEIVLKYLPMVKYIARRHYSKWMEFDDLLQEGLIGLLGAIREYQPGRFGIKFSSFAYLCILRKIYNAIKQTNGAKHRALNDAVYLFGGSRPLAEALPDSGRTGDPAEWVEERQSGKEIEEVLRIHLSELEYAVVSLLWQGYSGHEIEQAIGVNRKAVDNARTRVRVKLRRLIGRYGSLLDPRVPVEARRRPDLCTRLSRRTPLRGRGTAVRSAG
ncbi:MAG TPA: sigma-70 family RNA polymerase sigma factor [Limnochordia bacterium]